MPIEKDPQCYSLCSMQRTMGGGGGGGEMKKSVLTYHVGHVTIQLHGVLVREDCTCERPISRCRLGHPLASRVAERAARALGEPGYCCFVSV